MFDPSSNQERRIEVTPRSAEDTRPVVSDGRVVFVRSRGNRQALYVASLSGGRARQVPLRELGTGDPEKDLDSWKLVHFTRHLPQLTQEELDEMKTLNPKTPNELLEEAAFDRFLEGTDTGGKSVEGHHH